MVDLRQERETIETGSTTTFAHIRDDIQMASKSDQRAASGGDSPTKFSKSIRSKVLGRLRLECIHIEILGEDLYHYASTIKTNRYAILSIVVHADRDENPDWKGAVARGESTFPMVLAREPAIRRAALPAIRRLLKRYGYGSSLPDAKLMSEMKLMQVMFVGKKSVELSYSGQKPFHGLNIQMILGPRLGLREVYFDG